MDGFQFPMKRKRAQVEVVTCPTLDRPSGLDGKRKKAGISSPGDDGMNRTVVDAKSVREEFQEAMESVREFGMSGFNAKERRKYENEKIVALGGKGLKDQKVPYKLLMALRKAKGKREKKKELENKQSDVVTGKRQERKKPVGNGKKRDGGLHATPGRLKHGVLHLPKNL